MVQEAFKKQYLSSHEVFQAKRWEGKPWRFKLRYLVSNYPELALATFGFLVIAPALVAIRCYTLNEEKATAKRKYKMHYSVVRDDDPNIENIIKLKECGRQYFPN